MVTATKPGSDSEHLLTFRDGENEEEMKWQPQSPPERCECDGWVLVFVTGIMSFASFALQTQMR